MKLDCLKSACVISRLWIQIRLSRFFSSLFFFQDNDSDEIRSLEREKKFLGLTTKSDKGVTSYYSTSSEIHFRRRRTIPRIVNRESDTVSKTIE